MIYFIICSIIIFFAIYLLYEFLFNKNYPIIISIDGNIGSGKSTLLKILKQELNNNNLIYLEEPVDDWKKIADNNTNILNEFYLDKKRWGYTFQNLAFITRSSILLDTIKKSKTNIFQKRKVILTERSTETDKNIFAKMLYDQKIISELEFKLYNYWYEKLFNEIKIKNIIYLRTTPIEAYERIKKRSRCEEKNIPIDYIQTVHQYHDNWLLERSLDCNVCYIDNKNNLIDDEKTKKKVIKSITVFINSLESRLNIPA